MYDRASGDADTSVVPTPPTGPGLPIPSDSLSPFLSLLLASYTTPCPTHSLTCGIEVEVEPPMHIVNVAAHRQGGMSNLRSISNHNDFNLLHHRPRRRSKLLCHLCCTQTYAGRGRVRRQLCHRAPCFLTHLVVERIVFSTLPSVFASGQFNDCAINLRVRVCISRARNHARSRARSSLP